MEKIISCCGVICSDCEYYPEDCSGCNNVKGKVFWLQYTEEDVCSLYNCCINTKGYVHCGECSLLPCEKFEENDPTKTSEENARDHKEQLEMLHLIKTKVNE